MNYSEDWDSLPKPWSKEECRRRYVESSDSISFSKLAQASGVGESTLFRWSTEGAKNGQEGWVAQREVYQRELRELTRSKTLEQTSSKLSAELSRTAVECYKPHKTLLTYATKVIDLKMRRLRGLENRDQEIIDKELKTNHIASELDYWSKIVARSTEAISRLTGLEYYVNLNAAAAKVESEGYTIVDPSEDDKD